MILGILSDSHGQHERTARALRMLQRLGAEAFIHCGDIQTESVLEELAVVQARFVWGNTDQHGIGNAGYAETLGLEPPTKVPLVLEFAGKKLAVFHGHERAFERVRRALAADNAERAKRAAAGCDYLLYGHTHVPQDIRIGSLRIINPGALRRAATHTVATLDLERDVVEFWRVNGEAGGASEPERRPIR